MSNRTDWELKYKTLLSKYMNGIDLAFQKGYQKGLDDSEKEQMMQEKQAQAEAEAAANGQQLPGQEQPDPNDPAAINSDQADMAESQGQPNNTELDQSLQEMEALVAKSKGKIKDELVKSLNKIKQDADALNKSLYKVSKLKETQKAVNITTGKSAPKVLTEQHKVVKSMIANWDVESSEASSEIEKAIKNDKQ